MKTIVFALLICFLATFATANTSTISIESFVGSNKWWIAIAVRNANVDTQSIQIKDSVSPHWGSLKKHSDWGYWTISSDSDTGFSFPVSLELTSANGDHIVLDNILELGVSEVDTLLQYASSEEVAPVDSTDTDVTAMAADAQAQPQAQGGSRGGNNGKGGNNKGNKDKATVAPTTPSKSGGKATTAPAKPTTAPAKPTTAPAKAPTTAPSSGCSGPMKLLVPLYVDPGTAWDVVAASGLVIPTVAIINPDSGPGNGPSGSYNTYMSKLHAAGVEMVGYVHTSYGARSITDVKADIAKWASEFPLVTGIFIDEAATSSSQVSYYTQVHQYIMSMPGYKYNILNPGTPPASAYVSISTQIVLYESAASGFTGSSQPSFASCATKDHFAMIVYGASSTSSMSSALQSAKSKGYYGWVYATSGTASGNTYGSLPSYYASMASTLASLN